jgi:cob(I)alamin adenosyltransferase
MKIEAPPTEKPYDKPQGERRGLLIVNTGDGKGKSTAAFGLALRALGRTHVHGKGVKIYQFMKVPSAHFGEHRMFEQLGLPIEELEKPRFRALGAARARWLAQSEGFYFEWREFHGGT